MGNPPVSCPDLKGLGLRSVSPCSGSVSTVGSVVGSVVGSGVGSGVVTGATSGSCSGATSASVMISSTITSASGKYCPSNSFLNIFSASSLLGAIIGAVSVLPVLKDVNFTLNFFVPSAPSSSTLGSRSLSPLAIRAVSPAPEARPPTVNPTANSIVLLASASPVITFLSESYRFLASKSRTAPSPKDSCEPSAIPLLIAFLDA